MGARNEGMVYVRGFDLRQVPLFIDGVPVYVPYDGYVDLDRFVTDDLSEVRVTKGMTSVLIGPNALGGAINLVTKRPTRPFSGLFNVGYASGKRARPRRKRSASCGPSWYVHGTGSWIGADNFPLSGDFTPNAASKMAALATTRPAATAKGSVKFAWTPSGRRRVRRQLRRPAGPEGCADLRRHESGGDAALLALAGLGQGRRLPRDEHAPLRIAVPSGPRVLRSLLQPAAVVRRRELHHADDDRRRSTASTTTTRLAAASNTARASAVVIRCAPRRTSRKTSTASTTSAVRCSTSTIARSRWASKTCLRISSRVTRRRRHRRSIGR